jgi:AcrR family transcriptional regulator
VPKIVDHEERRQEVLAAVWRIIDREGIERSTIRAIAKEAGYSAGILAHYFSDKDDILTSALRLSHERITERWNAKLEGLEGIAALRELVLDNLPLDEERQIETKLEISYWTSALTRAEVLAVQETEAEILRKRIVTLVREAQDEGEITSERSGDEIAELLLALIDGLSLHAILYPQRLPPRLQSEIIERELERLRPPA